MLIFSIQCFCQTTIAEKFKQEGFVEIYDENFNAATFDSLYTQFDEFVQFLHTNSTWLHKLYSAKERFIRSKDRNFYSTDFFGLYDESSVRGRGQISFYYSIHFHEFICSRYPEFSKIPEITNFFEACFEIQKPYSSLFNEAAAELGLSAIFASEYGQPPILLKIVKYLPSYTPSRPHYDGSAFSLFIDSTDNASLLLSPYRPSFSMSDFSSAQREFSRIDSILLIPGTLLTEFSICPTPHIVAQKGQLRYATIAFAMRPNYTHQNPGLPSLPNFNVE